MQITTQLTYEEYLCQAQILNRNICFSMNYYALEASLYVHSRSIKFASPCPLT